MKKIIRCDWANKSELEQKYHDEEWGVPVHNDKKLFKMLILEGKQIKAVVEDDLAKGKEIAYMAAEEIKKKINKGNIQ